MDRNALVCCLEQAGRMNNNLDVHRHWIAPGCSAFARYASIARFSIGPLWQSLRIKAVHHAFEDSESHSGSRGVLKKIM